MTNRKENLRLFSDHTQRGNLLLISLFAVFFQPRLRLLSVVGLQNELNTLSKVFHSRRPFNPQATLNSDINNHRASATQQDNTGNPTTIALTYDIVLKLGKEIASSFQAEELCVEIKRARK